MTISKNRVKVHTVGVNPTTPFALGDPVTGFSTFPQGDVTYAAVSEDGHWEIAYGVVSGTTLTRGNLQENYLGTLDLIDFTSEVVQIAQVFSVASMNEITNKLDTIEIGATRDMSGDEILAIIGAEPGNSLFTEADRVKLDSIEPNAKDDQYASEVEFLYENIANTNKFEDEEKEKLRRSDWNAADDQTPAELKFGYESNLNTNEFNDFEKAKLDGIEIEAKDDQNAHEVPFTSISDLQAGTVRDALEELNTLNKDHDQPATTIIYDSTNDPVSSDTDAQDALVTHGENIDQRVASATGIITGGKLTATIGGSLFNVESGTGRIFDSYTDPLYTVSTPVAWGEITGISIAPEIGSLEIGAIKVFIREDYGSPYMYKIAGNAPLSLFRDHIFVGIVHVVNGAITDITPAPSVIKQTATDTYDLLTAITRISGGYVFAIENTLSIWQQAGTIFFPGINWHNTDHKNPNVFGFPDTSPEPRQPIEYHCISSSGNILETRDTIPQYWENSGSFDNIVGDTAVIHRLYTIGFNDGQRQFALLYGQHLYDTAEKAKSNLLIESVNVPAEVDNMYFIGYICVSGNSTNFDDGADSWIVSGEFGKTTSALTSSIDHNVLINRDFVDQHAMSAISGLVPELDGKMKWLGEWFPGTYNRNDVVRDGEWTMIANQETTDVPSPQLVGDSLFSYFGTLIDTQISAKVLYSGVRYYWQPADIGYVVGWKYHTFTGQDYGVFIVKDPLGNPKVTELLSTTTATSTGWKEYTLPFNLVEAGTVFDIIVRSSIATAVPVSETFNYNWVNSPNNDQPIEGQVIHSDHNPSVLRVHKRDADGVYRTVSLEALEAGDILDSGSVRYSLMGYVDYGVFLDFLISPTTLSPEGALAVTIETSQHHDVHYGRELGVHTGDPNTRGLYIFDGYYISAAENDNQYGVDIRLQHASLSTEWDTVATSSEGVNTDTGDDNDTDPVWGTIVGAITSQIDLVDELVTKEPVISPKLTSFNKDFGTITNTVCEGDDIRLSDTRVPTTHNHDSLYWSIPTSTYYYNQSLKTVDEIPPSNPVEGQEWIDPSNNRNYTYYANGAGDWVEE